MEDIVASSENIKFDVEVALEQQVGIVQLAFPGMDKSNAAVCSFYIQGTCGRGATCPFRHVKRDRQVVCKHWLRALCKKGDECEYLHQFDKSKMPECYFFSKFGQCMNRECPFQHVDPNAKVRDCVWYDRGFCRHGPNCPNRHVRRVACQNYINGFCPLGKECKYAHPKWVITPADYLEPWKLKITCHWCGERGHKLSQCPTMPHHLRDYLHQLTAVVQQGNTGAPLPVGSGAAVPAAPTNTAFPGGDRDHEHREDEPFSRRPLHVRLATPTEADGDQAAMSDPHSQLQSHMNAAGGGGGERSYNDLGPRSGGGQSGLVVGGFAPSMVPPSLGPHGMSSNAENYSASHDRPMRTGGRSAEHVTCFRCGQKGHYANSCPEPPGGDMPARFGGPRRPGFNGGQRGQRH